MFFGEKRKSKTNFDLLLGALGPALVLFCFVFDKFFSERRGTMLVMHWLVV